MSRPRTFRRGGPRRLAALVALAASLVVSGAASSAEDASDADWLRIGYGELVDRRELSHSGESVGTLLERLSRSPDDRLMLSLLDPLLEPYAYVLTDALDVLEPMGPRARVELGAMWNAGERQPAWVELLRARRYIAESDGRGNLRLCLPFDAGAAGPVDPQSQAAAQAAFDAAWPVLRHLFAAERLRLAAGDAAQLPGVQVEVHAYRHLPERSEFLLGRAAHRVVVDDTRPRGDRPPLDLEAIQRFLDSGLRLEGARLDADGSLNLLGSSRAQAMSVLGRPLQLADFAVAYRAVAHGGLAEPYMSLDRGYSPQRSIVTYGGRLRDTALGLVSLRCDIRFKTFSLGLDIVEGSDLRDRLRESLPTFRTHLERMARDPASADRAGQQTRLWFYPDDVDLTLSATGDVLVLRKVRMSAASERVDVGPTAAGRGEEPAWTRATVDAINDGYDVLSRFFPELDDLDQVVRLLALFTWLETAESDGLIVPELDALLALELPAMTTPRTFPQMLAYNALPPAGSAAAVGAYDRVEVGEALDALGPLDGSPLPVRRRYRRAMAGLEPRNPEHKKLLDEVEGYDVARLDESALDLLAYRAERLQMHELVLATLPSRTRSELEARDDRAGLRRFSVAIGGLDLGMGPVLARAAGRRLGLGPAGSDAVAAGRPPHRAVGNAPDGPIAAEPREAWRTDPSSLPAVALPGQAADGGDGAVVERTGEVAQDGGTRRWRRSTSGFDGPDPRSRLVTFGTDSRAESFERFEAGRSQRYYFERRPTAWIARRDDTEAPAAVEPGLPSGADLPDALALMTIAAPLPAVAAGAETEGRGVRVRLVSAATGSGQGLETDFPRRVLQRLVLGHAADLLPDQPLPGLEPLPPQLGAVERLMLMLRPEQRQTPWERELPEAAGEEDPVRVARSLDRWWSHRGLRTRAVVGVDPLESAGRWSAAPEHAGPSTLLLPEDGFPVQPAAFVDGLRRSWNAGPVRGSLDPGDPAKLIVLVSAEPADRFAARLRDLAATGALRGRYLAVWSLSAPVRLDFAAGLIELGGLSGLGLAEPSVVGQRDLAGQLGAWSTALHRAAAAGDRIEAVAGPFLWFF